MSIEHIRVRVLKELWQKYHLSPSWYQFDKWLDREFKANPAFGKRDRKWYSEYLFAGFRFGHLALSLLDSAGEATEAKARFLQHNHNDFWALIEARVPLENFFDREGAEQILAPLRQRVAADTVTLPELLQWNGLPPLWADFVRDRQLRSQWTNTELQIFVGQLSERAPLWIRVARGERLAQVRTALENSEIKILESDGAALRIESKASLKNNESFLRGDFDIQDWASQQILAGIEVRKFKRIWDTCAGAGGKSLQLAAQLPLDAEIFASDIREHALRELQRRAERAQLKSIKTFLWQGEARPEAQYDLVLVDAPCSSSGVLRRNPELRFKIDLTDLVALQTLQLQLLRAAAQSVRVGGTLCYGTCSFLTAENEAVVEQFNLSAAGFVCERQGLHGSPRMNSDATFSAIWRREA